MDNMSRIAIRRRTGFSGHLPLIILILGLFLSIDSVQANPTSYSQQHDAALRYFTSGKEPKVKDAIWTSETIFKVGLLDNGTSRDGYASYVCEVLYEYGFKGRSIWVQAIDIAVLKRTGKWVKLGEARCR